MTMISASHSIGKATSFGLPAFAPGTWANQLASPQTQSTWASRFWDLCDGCRTAFQLARRLYRDHATPPTPREDHDPVLTVCWASVSLPPQPRSGSSGPQFSRQFLPQLPQANLVRDAVFSFSKETPPHTSRYQKITAAGIGVT